MFIDQISSELVADSNQEGLRLLPLGGLGEIGMNLMALEYEDEIFIVDCGLMFPEPYMLGVDIVIPDISALLAEKERVKGIILTHGHEDHIGALPFILPQLKVPVYGTELTIAMVSRRLEEHQLLDQCELCVIRAGETISSNNFSIEFISVVHSIPQGVALAITTPVGLIVHSGDFKIDYTPLDGQPTDLNRLAQLGSEGVDLLLSDSTNVESAGYSASEAEVKKAFAGLFSESSGRIIITLFSSNLNRIQEIIRLAHEQGRKVAVLGRSLHNNLLISQEIALLQIPPDTLIDIEEIKSLPANEVLVITTGSQGEPFSGLSLMASNKSKWISVEPGDTVIFSSRFIPGNEKAISHLLNRLSRLGARVLYRQIAFTHVSGHAYRDELGLLLNLVKPRHFIPIHGEYRHLDQHARLAVERGVAPDKALIVTDGDLVELDETGLRRLGRIEHGKVLVDGKGVGEIDFATLHDRRHLSHNGMVMIVVGINESTGEIVYGPEITTKGLVADENETILDEARTVVDAALAQIPLVERNDWIEVKAILRRAVKKYFRTTLNKKPIILPVIIEL
ncbi:MAG: ribonuclease J [Pseudomonadota bacterium]|nr:ribonuclease J [Pseudomonadota bacterium]